MPEHNRNFTISEDLQRRIEIYLQVQDSLKGPALAAFRYQQYTEALNWANIVKMMVDAGEEKYPGAQEKFQNAQHHVKETFTHLRATCQDLGI